MSIYALQVEVGKESLVKEQLLRLLKHYQCADIATVYACDSTIHSKSHIRRIGELAGYIFIRLSAGVEEISATAWHIIKNTPKVLKILANSITEEEFARFYDALVCTDTFVVDNPAEASEESEVVCEAKALQSEMNAHPLHGNRIFAGFSLLQKGNKAYIRFPSQVTEWLNAAISLSYTEKIAYVLRHMRKMLTTLTGPA